MEARIEARAGGVVFIYFTIVTIGALGFLYVKRRRRRLERHVVAAPDSRA